MSVGHPPPLVLKRPVAFGRPLDIVRLSPPVKVRFEPNGLKPERPCQPDSSIQKNRIVSMIDATRKKMLHVIALEQATSVYAYYLHKRTRLPDHQQLASLRAPSGIIVRQKIMPAILASVRSAPVKSAPIMLDQPRLAPVSFVSCKFVPSRFAP